MGEFDLIAKYFTRPARRASLGVGDDCALLRPTPGTEWAISSDMLVEGRHFLATVPPHRLGHKALAVNLSDLAACGATPVAFTLALALPRVDEAWLAGFSRGLLALADAHGCELVGGDTTQGPLNICITVFGEVPLLQDATAPERQPRSLALLRSGARAGDDLYVSGTVGDARLALEAFRGRLQLPQHLFEQARLRMEQPTPRVALGIALRGIASAAVDVSDGLLGDLQHVLRASRVGATINTQIATQLIAICRTSIDHEGQFDQEFSETVAIDHDTLLECALAGGDDYELLFTAPVHARAQVVEAARLAATQVTRIGRIDTEPGVRLLDAHGQMLPRQFTSFDHFA